jgi:hypothetical protein
MAETLVKNRVCTACGADIRAGAFFCYNCGSSVSADAVALPEKNGRNNQGEKTEKLLSLEKTLEDENAAAAEKKETAEKNEPEKNEPETAAEKEPELKSAASMRRRPKTIQRKRIEVTWEEPASAPNIWFLLVAVLLTGFAVGLWLLASYLE